MARVIKSITVAGSTVVVTETVAGALSSLGSVTDAWAYSGGRWGITLDPSSLKDYARKRDSLRRRDEGRRRLR